MLTCRNSRQRRASSGDVERRCKAKTRPARSGYGPEVGECDLELLLRQQEAATVIIRQAMTTAASARNSLMPPRRAQALYDGDHREHEHGGHRGGQDVGKQ